MCRTRHAERSQIWRAANYLPRNALDCTKQHSSMSMEHSCSSDVSLHRVYCMRLLEIV